MNGKKIKKINGIYLNVIEDSINDLKSIYDYTKNIDKNVDFSIKELEKLKRKYFNNEM